MITKIIDSIYIAYQIRLIRFRVKFPKAYKKLDFLF